MRHEDDFECTDSENKPCSSLPYPCISCYMNDSCVYGNQTIATCKANVDCVVYTELEFYLFYIVQIECVYYFREKICLRKI